MKPYIPKANRYEAMPYIRCGKSGLNFPAVSLGLWHNFGKKYPFSNMDKMCRTAFDAGITHFDLANNYGFPDVGSAEENMGRLLKKTFGVYRRELLISTKAGYKMWEGPYGDFGSRKNLLTSLDESLLRLGLEYVDIFYHHRPDPETPLEETMGALSQAVKSGKALYVGLSNYDGEQMEKAADILESLHCPFVICQNRYSILDRRPENNQLLAAAKKRGKGVIAFSPLEQGLLSGKYLEGIPENSRVRTSGIYLREENLKPDILEKIRKLQTIAIERGETLSQMALRWVQSRESVVSVLVGASTPEQILENVKCAQGAPFSEEEEKKINEISLGA